MKMSNLEGGNVYVAKVMFDILRLFLKSTQRAGSFN